MGTMKDSHAGGGIWFAGFVGGVIWVVRNADGVGAFLWGLVQALFWPAVLVYRLFEAFS